MRERDRDREAGRLNARRIAPFVGADAGDKAPAGPRHALAGAAAIRVNGATGAEVGPVRMYQ